MRIKFNLIDLALVLFVGFLLFVLFFYTDVPKKGIKETFLESYNNFKKIHQEDSQEKNVLNPEEQKLIKNQLSGGEKHRSVFCQNNFFPFLAGSKWTYRLKGANLDDTIEIGIPSPKENIYFVDGRSFSLKNWTIRTLMRCADEKYIEMTDLNFLNLFDWKNIVTKPCEDNQFYFSFPQEKELTSETVLERVETGCLDRIFIDPDSGEKKNGYRENIEIKWKIEGSEKITVPAGEFDSVKINLEIKSQKEENGEIKVTQKTIYLWVAKEIGIIKITNREDLLANNLRDEPMFVQELISFQIPTEGRYKKRTP